MNSHPRLTLNPTAASPLMNTYHWLVILGFPPSVAAARLMPELFTAESNGLSRSEENPRCSNASLTQN